MRNRVFLSILVSFLLFFSNLALIGGATEESSEPSPTSPVDRAETEFSIALIPDSQIYSQSYPLIFDNQTEWIVNVTQDYNIKYMLHEGDITNRNTIPQWDNANHSIRILDGKVPYALSMGNHDTGTNGNAATRDTVYFNQYFPSWELMNYSTFGGLYNDSQSENSYHLFEAGGEKWLIFTTEFGPREDVLRWMNEVAENHTDRLIMMTTHAYTAPSGGRISTQNYGVQNEPGGANYGTGMWNKFVRNHHNFICVFSGHVWGAGSWRQAATGDNGNTVFEMLANYQDQPNGGNGWLRIVTFNTTDTTIRVQTYSPYLQWWKPASDTKHNFTLDYERWWYFNDPPVVKNDVPSFDLEEDDEARYIELDGYEDPTDGIFEDPNQADGDELSYALWNGKRWCQQGETCWFESDNMTVWVLDNDTVEVTPKENMFGSDELLLNATDTPGRHITKTMTINIGPVNDGPMFNHTTDWIYTDPRPQVEEGKITCLEDDWANFTVTAFDPIEPGDTLSFSSNTTDVPFFSIDGVTGGVSFQPLNEHVGTYDINLTVDDGGTVNNTDEYDLAIEIVNVNDDPLISTEDVAVALEDEWYSVDYNATDIDPTDDVFTWFLYTNAPFLTMDPTSGMLSGFPTNDDLGVYWVTVNVSDGNEGHDETSFDLTVRNTNDPPAILDPPADLSFDEDTVDTSIDLSAWFTDMDGDPLVFRSDEYDDITVTIDQDGNVTLEPDPNWNGAITLTFYASDTLIEISDVINITVDPVNDPPTDPSIMFEGQNWTEGGVHIAKGSAKDIDLPDDELKFLWSSNMTGSLGMGEELDLELKAGHHLITLKVTDSGGGAVEVQKEVVVHTKEAPPPPPPPPNGGNGGDKGLSSTVIFGLIGAIIAIVVVILVIFLLKRNKEEGPPVDLAPTPTEQPPPPPSPQTSPEPEPEPPAQPPVEGEDPPEMP